MKKMIDDQRLMIKVCDLHFNCKMNQRAIAEALKISAPTVAQLLSGAIAEGIVSISVNHLDSIKHWDIEQQLIARCGLKDACVTDSANSTEEQNKLLGEAAAKHLESVLSDGDKVGVSMGSTLYHLAHRAPERSFKNLTFIPLIGGMGRLHTELHSNHLAEVLSQNYNGKYLPLYAPARVSSESMLRELKKEPSISEILAEQKDVSIALVGIGYPGDRSAIKATGYYKDNEIHSLLTRKVAGEICMQFYNASGATASYKDANIVVGIHLNKLKKIPLRIGVAGGKDKLRAICGAINGKYINTLVTDVDCAKNLIDMYAKEKKDE